MGTYKLKPETTPLKTCIDLCGLTIDDFPMQLNGNSISGESFSHTLTKEDYKRVTGGNQ